MKEKGKPMRKKVDIIDRIIADNLGIPSAYYIWNPEYETPLCWDDKALTFTSEHAAKTFAESCMTKGEYTIKHLYDYRYDGGHIAADGLIVERQDKCNGGIWACEDALVAADEERDMDCDECERE